MDLFNRSLARRMTVLILGGTGLVLLMVLGGSYFLQREQALNAVINQDKILLQSASNHIEKELASPQATIDQTALLLNERDGLWGRAEVESLIRLTLTANSRIQGMALALSPEVSGHSDFKILYGWREGSRISVVDRQSPELDYQHDWFTLPAVRRTPQWIAPYYDADAQVSMVTYAVPLLQDGKVVAVLTCDLFLTKIREMLDGLPLGAGGIAVLLARDGTFVSHPQRELEMRHSIFSLAAAQRQKTDRETLTTLGQLMLSGETGFLHYRRPFTGDPAVIHYATIPDTGWALGLIRPKDQVLAPLLRLKKISALIGLGGIALLLLPALVVAWSVARPLRHLADVAEQLAQGDFAAPLPVVRGQDEVAHLTMAFGRMRHDLRGYIDELTASTAARQRIESELSIAREIQLGIIPKIFPPFPDRSDLDLHASIIPAREVGGDLYDFGFLDNDHLYLVIGDVSGKGVPASLLMAVGKTMLKSSIHNLRDPGLALAEVNADLAEDNDACMFITLFCAILNLKNGELIYANGGHNPPLLAAEGAEIISVDALSGPALGIVPGAAYENYTLCLAKGDLLVLYTDGITEAANPAEEYYGDDRLVDYLRQARLASAREFIEGLNGSVHDYAAGAEQSDDITSLVLRYLGRTEPG